MSRTPQNNNGLPVLPSERMDILIARVIKQWNSLLPEVMGEPGLKVFGQRLDSHCLEWSKIALEELQTTFQPSDSTVLF